MIIQLPIFNGDALCAEVDAELFFPEKGGATLAAKALCSQCEIRVPCAKWAIDTQEPHGVWGGISETQRRRMRGRTA